jgi:hypothetical protein
MNQDGKKLLELMFDQGEEICLSYNMFGYHSVPLKKVLTNDKITLIPTEESCVERGLVWEESFEQRFVDEMQLVALNPVKGFRVDSNCTAFRNFLVEIDIGTSEEQLNYIKKIGLPYSAAIFSGNKSLHFLVSLQEDLPNEQIWRTFAEWILNVATNADQKTKNPTRSIRMPGVWRDPNKMQKLVEFHGPIELKTLVKWLAEHPKAKPREHKRGTGQGKGLKVAYWAHKKMQDGIQKDRSHNWYAIGYEFALAGYTLDATIEHCSAFFTPERTFPVREWKATIKSAFKKVQGIR